VRCQACGEWEKAINVAGEHDRIHLRTTYYKYAKHLQSIGDFRNATHAYEKSGTHLVEVPRMLYEREELEELERYHLIITNMLMPVN
jgi:intraflagellar transport protein 140